MQSLYPCRVCNYIYILCCTRDTREEEKKKKREEEKKEEEEEKRYTTIHKAFIIDNLEEKSCFCFVV